MLYRTVLTVFLFGVRGFATGFFQAIYLYTPEVRMLLAVLLRMCEVNNCPMYCAGLSHISERLWHVAVFKLQSYWSNACSIYCPGMYMCQYISFNLYCNKLNVDKLRYYHFGNKLKYYQITTHHMEYVVHFNILLWFISWALPYIVAPYIKKLFNLDYIRLAVKSVECSLALMLAILFNCAIMLVTALLEHIYNFYKCLHTQAFR